MFNGKFHYKRQFSIAMLNYQRVDPKYIFDSLTLGPSDAPMIAFFLCIGHHWTLSYLVIGKAIWCNMVYLSLLLQTFKTRNLISNHITYTVSHDIM